MEVIRRHSKQVDPSLAHVHRLLLLVDQQPSDQVRPDETVPRTRFRLDQRLDPEAAAELVSAYEAGLSSHKLARQYNLSKTSVLKLLREPGVDVRYQGLTPDQIEQAARLYVGGLSLAQVGTQLGADRTTIWLALKKRGVTMRSPNAPGRPRR